MKLPIYGSPSGSATAAAAAAAAASNNATDIPVEKLDQYYTRVEELCNDILSDPGAPPAHPVLSALEEYTEITKVLLSSKDAPTITRKTSSNNGATSALLSSVNTRQTQSSITKADLLSYISDNAYAILTHDPVFVTPAILNAYVNLQSLLEQPESFPEIFYLYANKPVPKPTRTQPVTYSQPNPAKPSGAIPPATVDKALDSAIRVHDLSLALGIVDTTYCTPAYKRSKFLRSALFPTMGLVLAPPAAYTLATRFSLLQTSMDPATATNIAMAGILTYMSAVGMVGYVALTTANDQMVRVTWATGLPLWERWVREEERAAVDKIAQAWGFKSMDRWGEEEGVEWAGLKEWIGMRGMVLDRVELMEGME
ncbi:hypothetical protein H2203_004170 [Taxawa tesnikishii (nom. ined.)]|nr:hypothetical protein H2203_004170 [Dothideales sp. JES 119]